MTSLSKKNINCPKCHQSFSIITEASINTWMNPELVEKFLNDQYYFSCPFCGATVHFGHTMIISGPKGMFSMRNDASYDSKKAKLIEYGVLQGEGQDSSSYVKETISNLEKTKKENIERKKQKNPQITLKTMILELYSVLRSKRFKEMKIDNFDWNDYNKITLKINEEQEREHNPNYSNPLSDNSALLEDDEELMNTWKKIKEIMAQEQRPLRS
ncbi:CpXC domain-containing protein [Promethearchaeum syntrophicum]|uniref:CpXC domain-containing protein n=1 Tax=Promethearchaeum syntrophicum TaxID=2594042 RepID=A0A5B9DCY0_9ARCH|nr:CpXC domain-containing protein [Candidatus Prometheoarchaeum syntrophicum]QEE17169.1 hypothetical protein DSAG12_03001 [Candidatus Prometheoarchaeum syntrophicum]